MDAKEFQTFGHQVVDLLAEYLENIEDKPVFPDADPKAINRAVRRSGCPTTPSLSKKFCKNSVRSFFPIARTLAIPDIWG